MISVSLVIATKNEEENIAPLLRGVDDALAPYNLELTYEVIVVDDSTDKTAMIAESLGARVIKGQRKGLGQAIIDGINASKNDVVLVMDADGSHDTKSILSLLKPIWEHGVDLTIGSRYVSGGDFSKWALNRKIKSLIGVKLMQLVTGVHDSNSGFFACFPKGTKVVALKHVRYGTVSPVSKEKQYAYFGDTYKKEPCNIEDIKVGDKVLSYNEITSEKELDEVTHIFKRQATRFVFLKFSNGNELRCTIEHPIAVSREGRVEWIPANQLKLGDKCIQYIYHGLNRRLYRTANRGKKWEDVFGLEKTQDMKRKFREHMLPSLLGNKRTLGYRHTAESRAKISLAHRGIVKSLETKQRMSTAQQKRSSEISQQFKALWNNPDYAKRIMKSWGKRPTNLEKVLSYMLRHVCPREFRYNGDGRLKLEFDGIYPDFVNVNGKKKVIEVFAPYHKLLKYGTIAEYEKQRMERFKKIGYEVLFIEKDEFKHRIDLGNKILTFVHNPNVQIVEVTNITYEERQDEVYNIETCKNHNYFAYGILVHNCRKNIVDTSKLNGKTWKIMLEILFQGNWISKLEVPITFADRTSGESKRSTKQVMKDAVNLVKLVGYKYQRFIKFALVGGIGNFWHYGLLWILTEYAGLWYGTSLAISVFVAMTNNYFINHYWSFSDRKDSNKNLAVGWLKFCGQSAIGDYGIAYPLTLLLTSVFGVWYMLSSFLASGVAVFVKFALAKRWVWGKTKRSAKDADYEWVSFYQGFPWQKRWKRIIASITKEFAEYPDGEAGKVLECGCGSSPGGVMVNHSDYIGYDMNNSKIRYMNAKNLRDCDFITGGFDEIRDCVLGGSIDTILFIEVIEHLNDIDEARNGLKVLHSKLRPNGKLVVATPNFGGFMGRTMDNLYGVFQKGAYKEEHNLKFGLKSLRMLCEHCGFKYVRSEIPFGADIVCLFRKED